MNDNFDDDDYLFSVEEDEEFDILIKTELASDLVMLLDFTKTSRSKIAEKLGWKKSRITSLLSGNNNPTIKTIYEFSKALGYGFSVNFTDKETPKARQPWDLKTSQNEIIPSSQSFISSSFNEIVNYNHPTIRLQTRREVQEDFVNGKGSDFYLSLTSSIATSSGRFGYLDSFDDKALEITSDEGLYLNLYEVSENEPQTI